MNDGSEHRQAVERMTQLLEPAIYGGPFGHSQRVPSPCQHLDWDHVRRVCKGCGVTKMELYYQENP